VRIGAVRLEAPIPNEARPIHPEGPQHQPLDKTVHSLPGDRFDRLLQIEKTLAGVTEPLAGLKVGFERQVWIAPIRQTPAMVEDLPGRNRRYQMVGGQIVRKIAAERSVQRQTFLIRQLQHRMGKDWFAQRRRVKDGVLINRGGYLPSSRPAVEITLEAATPDDG
jgi:hypothetical protein